METQESTEPTSHKEIPDTNVEETIAPVVEEQVQATEAKIEEVNSDI